MSSTPDWLTEGWPHIWLLYAQRKTAPVPLAVVRSEGARLKLADGRDIRDGEHDSRNKLSLFPRCKHITRTPLNENQGSGDRAQSGE